METSSVLTLPSSVIPSDVNAAVKIFILCIPDEECDFPLLSHYLRETITGYIGYSKKVKKLFFSTKNSPFFIQCSSMKTFEKTPNLFTNTSNCSLLFFMPFWMLLNSLKPSNTVCLHPCLQQLQGKEEMPPPCLLCLAGIMSIRLTVFSHSIWQPHLSAKYQTVSLLSVSICVVCSSWLC